MKNWKVELITEDKKIEEMDLPGRCAIPIPTCNRNDASE